MRLIVITLAALFVFSCQSTEVRNPAEAEAGIKKGQILDCSSYGGYAFGFNEDLKQGMKQTLALRSWNHEESSVVGMDFKKYKNVEQAHIHMEDCPDENQCSVMDVYFDANKVGANGKVDVSFVDTSKYRGKQYNSTEVVTCTVKN